MFLRRKKKGKRKAKKNKKRERERLRLSDSGTLSLFELKLPCSSRDGFKIWTSLPSKPRPFQDTLGIFYKKDDTLISNNNFLFYTSVYTL